MKGSIQADHINSTRYRFRVGGVEITPVSIGAIEQNLGKVSLPDDTVESNGRKSAGEFDLTIPAHHSVDVAFMDAWYEEGNGVATPGYKKPCQSTALSATEEKSRVIAIDGVWVTGRQEAELALEGEGSMVVIVYKMSFDDATPL